MIRVSGSWNTNETPRCGYFSPRLWVHCANFSRVCPRYDTTYPLRKEIMLQRRKEALELYKN